MIKRYLSGHLFQYVYILILFALVVTALNTDIQHIYKAFIIVLSIVVYFFWSIWHHWEDHKITISVLLEYLFLMLILLWLLFNLSS
jgi:hypothetical protein